MNENRIKMTTSAMYLVVDGSSKKLAFGVGGVEVMPLFGSGKPAFEDEFYSPNSNSSLAEFMAIHKGLDYAVENMTPQMKDLYIFADQKSMERIFSYEGTQFHVSIPDYEQNRYLVQEIRNKIIALSLSKGVEVNIVYLTEKEKEDFPDYLFWQNLSHMKSRSFMNKIHDIFGQENSPLLESSNAAKVAINDAASTVKKGFILRGTQFSFNLRKDENNFFVETTQNQTGEKVRVMNAKNIINATYHAVQKVKKELMEILPDLSDIHFKFYGDYNYESAMSEIKGLHDFFVRKNQDDDCLDIIERSAELMELMNSNTVRFSKHGPRKDIQK